MVAGQPSHPDAGTGRVRTVWLVLASLCVVAACGFQLRDQADLPAAMNRTHIAGLSPYNHFRVELERALRANGVAVVNPERAAAILRIKAERRGRRVLSVGTDGKVREFELYTTVNFEVEGRGNDLRLKKQILTVTRDFLFDETDVLGNTSEAELLYEDMEDELVRLMLYRLETLKPR
ncbi:MAG: LPS assembly lipoprotein LptE [Gammaproteobacteria bacterium]